MKNIIKTYTTENKKISKLLDFLQKNDVLKTSTSQRLSDSYGLRKSRVASRTPNFLKARTFGHHFSRKWKFEGSFRHHWKSEGACQIDILSIDLCFWHKKWCQGALPEITWKTNGKCIETQWFFGWENLPKLCPVQWIQRFRHFRKNRKIDAKMTSKSHCRRRATPPHPKDTGQWWQNG